MSDIAQLVITSDGGVKRFPVGEGVYVIGRDPGCDLVIDSFFISRQHARITIAVDHFTLEDLASTSGTIVAGQSLSGKARFSYPQEVHLGALSVEVKRLTQTEPQVTQSQPNQPTTHYTPGKEIARGGMGAVLEANDDVLGRTVAMKVIRSGVGDSGSMRLRFIREATVLARLEHPNIVPIHEMGTDAEGRLFYTMKKVEGRTLQGVLDDLKRGESETVREYTLDRLLNVFRKVCDAMAFAHAQGVIHRDLKPENVMVGEYGEVLVMDWGLAKILQDETQTALELAQTSQAQLSSEGTLLPTGFQELSDSQLSGSSQNLTMDGAVMGSPQYMPPEQAEGKVAELDERSDIFSLGGILYSILTLKAPVEGRSVKEVLDNVKSGKITPPTHYNAGSSTSQGGKKLAKGEIKDPKLIVPLPHCPGGRVPSALSSVTMKAMAFAPEDRYGEVEELANDVEAYQRGFATSAEQVSAMGQVVLFVKRHKGVSISAGVALVLIVVLSLGFMLKVKVEKDNALVAEGEAKSKTAEAVRAQQEAQQALAEANIALAEGAYSVGDADRALMFLERCRDESRDYRWQYVRQFADESAYFIKMRAILRALANDPFEPGYVFTFEPVNKVGQVSDGFLLRRRNMMTGEVVESMKTSVDGVAKMAISKDTGIIGIALTGQKTKTYFFSTNPLKSLGEIDSDDLRTATAILPVRETGFFAVSCWGKTVLMNPTNKEVRTIEGFEARVSMPTGGKFLGFRDGHLAVHEVESGKTSNVGDLQTWGISADVSEDGERAVIIHYNGTVFIVDLKTGRLIREFLAYQRDGARVRFLEGDLDFITYGLDGENGSLKVWSMRKNGAPVRTIHCREGVDAEVTVNEAAGIVWISSDTTTAYRLPRLSADYLIRGGNARWVDEEKLAFAVVNNLGVYDLAKKEVIRRMSEYAGVARSRNYEFCSAYWPLYGGENKTDELVALKGDAGPKIPRFNHMSVAAISPDGSHVAVGNIEQVAVVKRTGGKVWKEVLHLSKGPGVIFEGVKNKTLRLGFPDSREPVLLLSCLIQEGKSLYRLYQTYDLNSGELLLSTKDSYAASVVIMDPTGKEFWVTGKNGVLHKYDASTLTRLASIRIHDGDTTSVAVSRKAGLLVTGDINGLVRFWKLVSEKGPELVGELMADAEIQSLDFSPSGEKILIQSGDRILLMKTSQVWAQWEVSKHIASGEIVWQE